MMPSVRPLLSSELHPCRVTGKGYYADPLGEKGQCCVVIILCVAGYMNEKVKAYAFVKYLE